MLLHGRFLYAQIQPLMTSSRLLVKSYSAIVRVIWRFVIEKLLNKNSYGSFSFNAIISP